MTSIKVAKFGVTFLTVSVEGTFGFIYSKLSFSNKQEFMSIVPSNNRETISVYPLYESLCTICTSASYLTPLIVCSDGTFMLKLSKRKTSSLTDDPLNTKLPEFQFIYREEVC
jgi:hypothetical protein